MRRRRRRLLSFRAIALLLFDRTGSVGHSAFLGGAVGGLVLCPSSGIWPALTSSAHAVSAPGEAARLRSLSADQFVAEEIDPLLKRFLGRAWQA